MKEREPATAGRHASLLLQILFHAFTNDTRGSLDTLDFLVQKYEPSTGTPLSGAVEKWHPCRKESETRMS